MARRLLPLFALALLSLPGCRTTRARTAWVVDPKLDDARRTTTSGEVVGGAARYGGYAWLGIPFAAPPVGDLRWRAPAAGDALEHAPRDAGLRPLVSAVQVGHGRHRV